MTTEAQAGDDGLVPVLQIVHVTDLHVKDTSANPAAALASKVRVLERYALNAIRRANLLGWEEGTQGHLPKAPKAFTRFLSTWWSSDPTWQEVPVWIVDTGDRTAFGDQASIDAGEQYLQAWSQALGNCPVRTLYGNHDMWPGTLPAFNLSEVRQQRERVRRTPGWDVHAWVTSPLSAPIPGRNATIDLYALDTIAWGSLWGALRNTRAVGQLRAAEVLHLQAMLAGAARRHSNGLRVLAIHHPLAFPWSRAEVRSGLASTMQLLKGQKWAAIVRNDQNVPPGIGPWAHLILSGHTHMSHPGHGVSRDVTSLSQGPLDAYQLQLVGGSLMLNRSSADRGDGGTPAHRRDADLFEPATVDPHPCQAQILRFFASRDPDDTWIEMVRTQVWSDDDGRHYVMGDPATLTLHYQIAGEPLKARAA